MILLVVDTQNLIMTEELYNFEVVKGNITQLIKEARANKIEVVYVCHDAGAGSKITPGTEGFEVFDEFKPLNNEKTFVKQYNSSFKDTGLNEYLKSKEVEDIVICGLQTDFCIDATIKSGFEHGYNMIVAKDSNSTFDNELLNSKQSFEYYNNFMWPDTYAKVLSIDAINTMMIN